jgi:hypothetical protein
MTKLREQRRINCNTKTTLWLLKVNVRQGRNNLKSKRIYEESSTAMFVYNPL